MSHCTCRFFQRDLFCPAHGVDWTGLAWDVLVVLAAVGLVLVALAFTACGEAPEPVEPHVCSPDAGCVPSCAGACPPLPRGAP